LKGLDAMAKKTLPQENQDVINIEDDVFKKLVIKVIKSKSDSIELERDEDISLSKKDKEINLDIKLNALYGKNILSEIHDMQREIKNSIEEYTCYKTSVINVEIKNIIDTSKRNIIKKKEENLKSAEKKRTKRSPN
jgi:uncharacterized alkaline shock family protein YloU